MAHSAVLQQPLYGACMTEARLVGVIVMEKKRYAMLVFDAGDFGTLEIKVPVSDVSDYSAMVGHRYKIYMRLLGDENELSYEYG